MNRANAFFISKKFWTVICCIVALLLFVFIPIKKTLTFQDLYSGEILTYVPIEEGQTFQLEYTHSIHRSTVIDTYKIISDNRIQQTTLQYEDLAIGMPSDALFEEETFVEKDGKYFIENMNRVFPSINLSTSQVVVSHKLNVRNNQYELHEYITPGSFITIEVRKLTIFQLVKGVNMNG